MKNRGIINSIWAAFAAYSRIPVPEADWNGENLRWQICCFPLVGAVTGMLWCGAGILMTAVGCHPVLSGAVLTVLPLLLTGGIHMDGFLDTSDAVHSWKPKEERLKILEDPHIGAFAFIYGAIYLILYFGLAVQLAALVQSEYAALREAASVLSAQGTAGGGKTLAAACMPFFVSVPGFVLCRVLSGLSVVCFVKAKKSGMLRSTADASDKKAAQVLAAELAAVLAVFVILSFFSGWFEILVLPAAAGLLFVYYYRMTMKYFGGVSGDPAGWFLQVCEIGLLAGNVLILFIFHT